MKLKLYQIDAFTDTLFSGNPAAVVILDKFLNQALMQKIATENNLSETAFVIKQNNNFAIRWFTPSIEVDLCGHATLAAAHVLYKYYDCQSDKIIFHSTASGILTVRKDDNWLTLDLPVDIYEKIETPQLLLDAFKLNPLETYKGKTDYLLIFPNQHAVEATKPDLNLIKAVGGRGVIISATGDEVDFISRFFAPQVGVDEDPVTGSAHTLLTPIWADKLDKNPLTAKQLSQRQGYLKCKYVKDRVEISGKAVTYLIGEINL